MTTQIHDSFELEPGEPFSVSAVNGTDLFDPRAHGLKPLAIHTGCYRGWYATYALRGTEMILARLAIGIDLPDGQAPDVRLGGVIARKHRYWYETRDGSRHEKDTPEWFYDDLALPVGFSGGLLVGRSFIRELSFTWGSTRRGSSGRSWSSCSTAAASSGGMIAPPRWRRSEPFPGTTAPGAARRRTSRGGSRRRSR